MVLLATCYLLYWNNTKQGTTGLAKQYNAVFYVILDNNMYITVLMHGILGFRVRVKVLQQFTSEIANWRLVEGTCTTAERPLAAQPNNKKSQT